MRSQIATVLARLIDYLKRVRAARYLVPLTFAAVGFTTYSFTQAESLSLLAPVEKGILSKTGGASMAYNNGDGYFYVKFGDGTAPPPSPTPSPEPTPGSSPSTPPPPPGSVSLLKPANTSTTHNDLRYSDSSTRSLLNLYTPNNGVATAPVIVYIHGGGWNSGSKDEYCMPYMKKMMNKGFAVACINYRLTDEAAFPAQIEDVKSAIRFLRANAKTYKLFDKRIGVWGGSAGGHLAAMAGTTGNYKGFDKGPNLSFSSSVEAVVDDYGPTDLAAWAQTPGGRSPGFAFNQERYSMVGKLLRAKVLEAPDKAKAANPITYVNAGDPPFMIMHGDADDIVPLNQSQLLDKALKAAKVPSSFTVVPGMGHGGDAKQSFSTERVNQLAVFFDNQLR